MLEPRRSSDIRHSSSFPRFSFTYHLASCQDRITGFQEVRKSHCERPALIRSLQSTFVDMGKLSHFPGNDQGLLTLAIQRNRME